MRKKAQNFVEVALLACVVVVVTLAVYTIYNNRKIDLVNMSRSNINMQSVNLNTVTSPKIDDRVPYNGTETAGSMSLKLLGMSSSQFNTAMANITYKLLKDALDNKDGQDIATLANALIAQLKLPYSEIKADNINLDTLSTLAGILNKVSEDSYNSDPTAKAFVDRFKSLLTAAGTKSISETAGNLGIIQPRDPETAGTGAFEATAQVGKITPASTGP